MNRSAAPGLTLLEVLVATSLLGLALLTLAALQLQTVQVQRRAQVTRELTRLVEGVLDRQIAQPAPGTRSCPEDLIPSPAEPSGIACSVSVVRCSDEVAGPGRLCGNSHSARAHGIRVRATMKPPNRQGELEFELRTVTARFLQ